MKYIITLLTVLYFSVLSFAQKEICISTVSEHTLVSTPLQEERTIWVSLPLHYNDSLSYPVIYVFDAEWRFDLIRNITFDLGANGKIEKSIVVGIPHVEWEFKRGQDLTFSHSRIEYDGEAVDSTWYNKGNSGNGINFYTYLTKEVLPFVNQTYSTNNYETLVGHSYGGYFASYLLSLEDNPFEVLHIYDPSIWYSNGEVIDRFLQKNSSSSTKIYLTYQPIPKFHKNKIEELIKALEAKENIDLKYRMYENETHNSLFLDSFYKGILQTNATLVE